MSPKGTECVFCMTLNPSANPPVCYPEQIFKENFNERADLAWWVVRTKSRQEKALAWNLMAHGIGYFLPLIPQPRKNRKRVRISFLPLFSGYVFFKGNIADRHVILRTNRVAQIIEVADQQALSFQLRHINNVLKLEKRLELRDFLSKGRKVRICHGPFKGVDGRVIRHKNRSFIELSVDCIGQAVRMEITMDMLEPVD